MIIEANFKGNFDHSKDKAICVLTIISMNSEKQSGDNFKAFLRSLNKQYELGRVQKLIIVVSGGLYLHYIKLDKELTNQKADKLAEDMDCCWITDNQEALKCLKFDYEILNWSKLLENQIEFNRFLNQIKDDYNFKDEIFKNKVRLHSGKYYAKKLYENLKGKISGIKLSDCEEAAINYVLNECAVLIALDRWADYLVYPGKINPCFEHVYEKAIENKETYIKFKEYKLKSISEKSSIFFQNNNFIQTKLFSDKEESKRKIRLDVANRTKAFLKNASSSQIKNFVEGFDKLLTTLNNEDESCKQRRLSC